MFFLEGGIFRFFIWEEPERVEMTERLNTFILIDLQWVPTNIWKSLLERSNLMSLVSCSVSVVGNSGKLVKKEYVDRKWVINFFEIIDN